MNGLNQVKEYDTIVFERKFKNGTSKTDQLNKSPRYPSQMISRITHIF